MPHDPSGRRLDHDIDELVAREARRIPRAAAELVRDAVDDGRSTAGRQGRHERADGKCRDDGLGRPGVVPRIRRRPISRIDRRQRRRWSRSRWMRTGAGARRMRSGSWAGTGWMRTGPGSRPWPRFRAGGSRCRIRRAGRSGLQLPERPRSVEMWPGVEVGHAPAEPRPRVGRMEGGDARQKRQGDHAACGGECGTRRTRVLRTSHRGCPGVGVNGRNSMRLAPAGTAWTKMSSGKSTLSDHVRIAS